MLQSTSRPPTDEERQIILAATRTEYAVYGCALTLIGAAPLVGCGVLGSWIGSLISPRGEQIGGIVGWSLGALWLLIVLLILIPHERRRRRRARKDAEEMRVQEWAITAIGARQLHDGKQARGYLLNIEEGKLLVLSGDWLWERKTHGSENEPTKDTNVEDGNAEGGSVKGNEHPPLSPTDSFPCDSFTLTRLPHSGKVLAMRVEGERLAHPYAYNINDFQYEFDESEVLEGDINDLASAVKRKRDEKKSSGYSQNDGF